MMQNESNKQALQLTDSTSINTNQSKLGGHLLAVHNELPVVHAVFRIIAMLVLDRP